MREYGINLPLFVNTITWRYFLSLLNGLSENSLTFNTVESRRSGKTAVRTTKAREKSILKQFF
jgi:hypothetical protein